MAVNAVQSKLVESTQIPQIVDALPLIANATDAATAITQVNAVIAALKAHGLIKEV